VVVLGDSSLQLTLAGALGLILAQLGSLGHEACHREIFRSARWNEWGGAWCPVFWSASATAGE
jgi:fatty acid desaturase